MIIPNRLYLNLSNYIDNKRPLDVNDWRTVEAIRIEGSLISVSVFSLKNTNHRVFVLYPRDKSIESTNFISPKDDTNAFLDGLLPIIEATAAYIKSDSHHDERTYGITGSASLSTEVHVMAYTLSLYGASIGDTKGYDVIFTDEYKKAIKQRFDLRADEVGLIKAGFELLDDKGKIYRPKRYNFAFALFLPYYHLTLPEATHIDIQTIHIIVIAITQIATALLLYFTNLDDYILSLFQKADFLPIPRLSELVKMAQSGLISTWVPSYVGISCIIAIASAIALGYSDSRSHFSAFRLALKSTFHTFGKVFIFLTFLVLLYLIIGTPTPERPLGHSHKIAFIMIGFSWLLYLSSYYLFSLFGLRKLRFKPTNTHMV